MNVLVTGVSGFIGGHIAVKLAKTGNNVFGLYRNTCPVRIKNIKNLNILQGNINNPRNLPNKIDYLVHCAADTPATTSCSNQLWETNCKGMQALLDWCSKSGVQKVLYLSTMAIYGETKEKWLDENTIPLNPCDYGKSKFAAEKILRKWSKKQKKPCITLRLPGVVGPGAKGTFIPNMVNNISNEKSVCVNEFSAKFNNIVHVDDLSSWVSNWNPNYSSYECINLSSKYPIKLKSIPLIIMDFFDKKVLVEEIQKGRRPFLIKNGRAKRKNFKIRKTSEVLIMYLRNCVN